MNKLTFATLREANLLRLPRFRDRRGNIAHSRPDGSDWSIDRWMNAFYGECGELSGEFKKAARGDYGQQVKDCMDEGRLRDLPNDVLLKIQREAADAIICLDLAMSQLGIDLGAAVMEKFNLVSDRVSAGIMLLERSEKLAGGEVVVIDDEAIPF